MPNDIHTKQKLYITHHRAQEHRAEHPIAIGWYWMPMPEPQPEPEPEPEPQVLGHCVPNPERRRRP